MCLVNHLIAVNLFGHPFGVTICVFPPHWSQVAIMAQDGFALLKQVAAAHLGNAAVQAQLWGAVRSLTINAGNLVRRP